MFPFQLKKKKKKKPCMRSICTDTSVNFHYKSKHFFTLKLLHSNKSIVITRPDKGSGLVILDYKCYVDKMASILVTVLNS